MAKKNFVCFTNLTHITTDPPPNSKILPTPLYFSAHSVVFDRSSISSNSLLASWRRETEWEVVRKCVSCAQPVHQPPYILNPLIFSIFSPIPLNCQPHSLGNSPVLLLLSSLRGLLFHNLHHIICHYIPL